jgi:nucleoside-triphosphatase THEP1
MVLTHKKLILWTGRKHSGKTTSTAGLVRIARDEGFDAAGLLAEALYHDGRLIGFDAIDLQTENRAPLARRRNGGGESVPFDFIAEGVELGRKALCIAATQSADLIVVDEFGPLEMNSQGWRTDVDLLIRTSEALILLVVREELAGQVQNLYLNIPSLRLCAADVESVEKVMSVLRGRRRVRRAAR